MFSSPVIFDRLTQLEVNASYTALKDSGNSAHVASEISAIGLVSAERDRLFITFHLPMSDTSLYRKVDCSAFLRTSRQV